MADKLTIEQINSFLKELTGWEYSEGSIKKTYKTRNYPSTMGFVTTIGGVCQRYNHHPDYILMKFKEVEISFSTHSVGGITQNDIDVAQEIDKILI